MHSIRMTVLTAALAAPLLAVAAPAAAPTATEAKSPADPRPAVRDWGLIDTNKDHLVSPEEMMAYLRANPGPLAPSRQAAVDDKAPAPALRTAAGAGEAPTTLR